MGTVIGEQARTLAASVLLGMALALVYDLLRAVRLRRRKNRALTGALDALFCAALGLSALLFALRLTGGELRLYTIFAAAAGAWLFFGALSPLLRPLWDFWARTLFELLRLLRLPLRKARLLLRRAEKFGKRLFLFSRHRLIIGSYRRYALRARRRAERREGVRYDCRKAEKTCKPDRGARRADPAGAGGDAAAAHPRPARHGFSRAKRLL